MSDARGDATPPALRAFVDELVARRRARRGASAPGSRSTPLALALRRAPGHPASGCTSTSARRRSSRSGMATAARRPVALLARPAPRRRTSSRRWSRRYLARVPLVVLTADRPPELRDRGAPQTIDQVGLYGGAREVVRRAAAARRRAARRCALAVARRPRRGRRRAPGRPGPVHLNLPFREPLLPRRARSAAEAAPDRGRGRLDGVASTGARCAAPTEQLARLADALAVVERGLIVGGPRTTPELRRRARRAGARRPASRSWPIRSRASGRPHDRSRRRAYDALLARRALDRRATARTSCSASARCRPPSRSTSSWRGARRASCRGRRRRRLARAAPRPPRRRPRRSGGAARGARGADRGRPRRAAPARRLRAWLAGRRGGRAARSRPWLAALDEPFEGELRRAGRARCPTARRSVAGNIMPVRDLDALAPRDRRAIRCARQPRRQRHRRRGLDARSGAAAVVTTGPSCWSSATSRSTTTSNGLLAARLPRPDADDRAAEQRRRRHLLVPAAGTTERPEVGLPEHFEQLFGTPHGLDFGRRPAPRWARRRADVDAPDAAARLAAQRRWTATPGVQRARATRPSGAATSSCTAHWPRGVAAERPGAPRGERT